MYRSVLQVGVGILLSFFGEFVQIIFHVIRVETASCQLWGGVKFLES